MHISHFSWEFPPAIWGGLGTFIMEMTQQQVKLGHNATVFALNDANKLKPEETWKGVHVFRPVTIELNQTFQLFANEDISSWGEHFQFFSDVLNYNITSAYLFHQKIKDSKVKKPDIIDGHDWLGVIGGMAAKKALNVPLVFHVHSTEQGRSLGGGSPTVQHIEYTAGQTADGIITVSHAMKGELLKLGFPEDKIHVCWNGVDPDKYNPDRFSKEEIHKLRTSYSINDDQFMIFFVGRLVTVKGADKLVKALPGVIQEFPECKLVILGVGDMEEHLHVLIDQLHLQDHVVIRPEFVNEEQRMLHYAASDLVVLPSLYEPFGIVCTEAMAMAKPVIVGAKGVTGMKEQIIPCGNDHCGYHINPFDPHDITWAINQVLQQDDHGKRLGENARKRVLKEFTWDVIAKRTLSIYKDVLQSVEKK